MKNISEDKKVDVLIAALKERYSSIHTIRERVQSVCLWTLGISIAATGWLVQADVIFRLSTTSLFILIIFVIYYVLRHVYFQDLEKGFRTQLQTAAKIENVLNLYEPAYFNTSDESIYPSAWREAGGKDSEGKFFISQSRLLQLGLGILVLALLLKTCFWFFS